MTSLKKHNKLEDFVRLLWDHRSQIQEAAPRPHAFKQGTDAISTGELCIIFTRSDNLLAKKFCHSFGMQSAQPSEFDKMLDRLRRKGFEKEATKLEKRAKKSYIDISHSANLLRNDSKRDRQNPYIYKDYFSFLHFQFLKGTAKRYTIAWGLLEKAILELNSTPVATHVGRKTRPIAKDKSPRQLASNVMEDLLESLEERGSFSPTSAQNAMEKTLLSINMRRGQPEFREVLLRVYRRKCAITGCDAIKALEAAHIMPYKGPDWNHPSNGLLLRADIHTLFDLHLLSIDHKTKRAVLAPELRDTIYSCLDGREVFVPVEKHSKPSKEALKGHMDQLGK